MQSGQHLPPRRHHRQFFLGLHFHAYRRHQPSPAVYLFLFSGHKIMHLAPPPPCRQADNFPHAYLCRHKINIPAPNITIAIIRCAQANNFTTPLAWSSNVSAIIPTCFTITSANRLYITRPATRPHLIITSTVTDVSTSLTHGTSTFITEISSVGIYSPLSRLFSNSSDNSEIILIARSGYGMSNASTVGVSAAVSTLKSPK